jgi:hypothetical protein
VSLRSAVERELAGQDGWQVEMALALAHEVDEKGTAAAAKELRSLLAELGATAPAVPKKETPLSDFERRLAERESAKAPRRAGRGA